MIDPRSKLRASFKARDRAINELRSQLGEERVLRESLRHELDAERAAREALGATLGRGLIDEMGAREELARRVDMGSSVSGPRMARLEAAVRRLEQGPWTVGRPDSATTAPSAPAAAHAGRDSADPELDPRLYLAIEDRFRGSTELVAERQAPYAQRLVAALGAGARVLDIGCGRGEFMGMLLGAGLAPVGVDTNVAAIDEVHSKGLEGICIDASDFLRAEPDNSLDGAVMFHLVEHMPVSATASLLMLLHEKIRPGGLLVIETPNPENVRVGANTFWLDPTHVRPVPPILLELLVQFHGFALVETFRLHPYDELPAQPSPADLALYGPQDFGLIARREED